MTKQTRQLTASRTAKVWLCVSIVCAASLIVFSVKSCAFVNSDQSLRIGTRAPDFQLTDLDGDEVVLSEIVARTEYVLIEFWASWCGPCVAKIPDLKTVYTQYNNGLLEVISIAREATALDWTKATKKYDLPWINLAELGEYRGEVGEAYGLVGLPLNYLVRQDGTIIAKDISIDTLKTVLSNQPNSQEGSRH